MTFFHLFLNADWVVKGVMAGLVFASLWSWSIIFSKIMVLRSLNRESEIAIESFSEASLEKSDFHRFGEDRAFSYLIALAAQEWQRSNNMAGALSESGVQSCQGLMIQRLEHLMAVHVDQQRETLSSGMGVLASISSMSPFVGLFGTVWGIMNSFQAIALCESASLSVVAPGIAEALFATAIGLVVAIPAAIGYSRLSVMVHHYGVQMENFSQTVLATCLRPLQPNTSFGHGVYHPERVSGPSGGHNTF